MIFIFCYFIQLYDMKKALKLIFPVLLVFFSLNQAYSKVISKINSQEKIEGKVDCWLVKYSLWEDHDNILPDDDTKLGDYTTVVGDCSDSGQLINSNKDFALEEIMDPHEFILSPNPARDHLEIMLPVNDRPQNRVWAIYNITGERLMNGIFDNDHRISSERIDIKSLNNGIYLFSINDGNNILSRKFIISKK